MATAWGGADPIQVADASDYELGIEWRANEDLVISHIRVWAGAGELGFSGRRGRIWTTGGGLLATAVLPDTLPVGWSVHQLDEPVMRSVGQHWVASYSTGGRYGALVGALDSAVNSEDDAVTAVAASSAINGNGSFEGTPGQFPTTPSSNNAFYGVDVVYSVGFTGNTSPRITQLTADANGATVTAIAVAEDDEGLDGATYRWSWGDGTDDTVTAVGTAQHVYTVSGLYAVLCTVTDSGGLEGYRAVPVDVVVPAGDLIAFSTREIIAAVRSHAMASGHFATTVGHEPISAPRDGLTCAVWMQRGPAPTARTSGLAATSARLILNVRIYTSLLPEPADEIDPRIADAVDTLMAAYNGDFTLGGRVSEVDIFGAHGAPLDAVAGYLPQKDGPPHRVMTITLPVIIHNAWEQSP